MASSIDAWIAEGSRLLELAAVSKKDRQSITEAIDTAATLLKKAMPRGPPTRARVKRQRPSPLDAGIASGATERALSFLDHRSLCALRACGSGVRAVASSDRIWSSLTAREFPETAQLQQARLLSGALDRRTYERFSGLWKGTLTQSYLPRPPGVDAYRAIVKVEHDGSHVEGLCNIVDSPSHTGFIVDASAVWAGILPVTSTHGMSKHPEMWRTLLQVSVSIVRNSDGKCLHIGTRLAADDVGDEFIILSDYDSRPNRPESRKSLLRSFVVGQRTEMLNSDSDFSHFIVLEGCQLREISIADDLFDNRCMLRSFELTQVGEFHLTMWDPDTETDYLRSDRILRCWNASPDWC